MELHGHLYFLHCSRLNLSIYIIQYHIFLCWQWDEACTDLSLNKLMIETGGRWRGLQKIANTINFFIMSCSNGFRQLKLFDWALALFVLHKTSCSHFKVQSNIQSLHTHLFLKFYPCPGNENSKVLNCDVVQVQRVFCHI